MKETWLDKFMSKKGLYTAFWIIALIMVAMLIRYTANLQKEVPPLPKEVKSVSGEVLYTYDDIIQGKGYFQEFDLTDWGSLLGMGAYIGLTSQLISCTTGLCIYTIFMVRKCMAKMMLILPTLNVLQ